MLNSSSPEGVVVSMPSVSGRNCTPPALQLLQQRHEVRQRAAQAVELPYDENVAFRQVLQAPCKSWAVHLRPRGYVVVKVTRVHSRRQERITLQIDTLPPLSGGDAHVADEPDRWLPQSLIPAAR
jgi:hypothetical protein